MGTIIFIIGLSGSGKTTLAESIKKERNAYLCDEGLISEHFNNIFTHIISNLKNDIECVVVEANLCTENGRKFIMDMLDRNVPGVKIQWKCFEKDIKKANKNIDLRALNGLKTDVSGHKKINDELLHQYTYPQGAEILPIIINR